MVQRNMDQTLYVLFRNLLLLWNSAGGNSVTLTGVVDVIKFHVLHKGCTCGSRTLRTCAAAQARY